MPTGREGVSVVLPAYNAAAFIAPAVESILRQTYRHFEIIIVDDGSTDGTAVIAREYAYEHDNIRAFSIPHAGVSAAMNFGIARSRFPWIAVMHADDIAMPRRLEMQLRASREKPDVIVWGSYALHMSPAGEVMSLSATGPTSVEAFEARRMAGRPVLVIHSSATIRRDALLAVGGYDTSFETSEDLDLFDRLSDLGPIVALPEPLVQRRIHASCNTMRTYARMHLLTRYVSERRRRMDKEGIVIDLFSFRESDVLRSRRERFRTWVHESSQFYYHRAAIHYGLKNHLRAVCLFIGSTCLNPAYSIGRAWHQLIAFRIGKSRTPESRGPGSSSMAVIDNLQRAKRTYEAA